MGGVARSLVVSADGGGDGSKVFMLTCFASGRFW